MKRVLDVLLASLATLVFILPFLFLAILVKLTSPGPILYWSNRVGRGNKIFSMPKFRTMLVDTPVVATHLLHDPDKYLSPIGGFLRRSSLDELPQLWCVLRSEMSLVGPRPALFNQDDLIAMRTEKGVHVVRPGLTGLAQVNGRDELPIAAKVILDAEYVQNQSLWLDLKILVRTVSKVMLTEGVSH